MLSKTKIYKMYRDSFIGTIFLNTLTYIKQDDDHRFYQCPCGFDDHFATRSIYKKSEVGDGFADILCCWGEDDTKWMVYTNYINNKNRVYGIIAGEERKYFKLLDESKYNIEKYMTKNRLNHISAKDLFILHATHGYDPSIIEGVIGDIQQYIYDEYLLLIEEHRKISRVKKSVLEI